MKDPKPRYSHASQNIDSLEESITCNAAAIKQVFPTFIRPPEQIVGCWAATTSGADEKDALSTGRVSSWLNTTDEPGDENEASELNCKTKLRDSGKWGNLPERKKKLRKKLPG